MIIYAFIYTYIGLNTSSWNFMEVESNWNAETLGFNQKKHLTNSSQTDMEYNWEGIDNQR
jgi:hypothetical protein